MALLNSAKSLILAKIESQYGTDPTPTALLNAFVVSEPKIEKIVVNKERKVTLPYLGSLADVQIGEGIKVSFQHEAHPSGAAGTAPKVGTLLRACNMTETINAGTSVVYAPNSSLEGESVTLWFYRDGTLHKALGCVGTVKHTFKTSEIAVFDFEFTGLYVGATYATDSTYPASITYDTNAASPIMCLNAAFSFGGAAKIIDTFSVDLGNEIGKRTDSNVASGVSRYYIKNRKTKGAFDPEAETLATVNYSSLQDASTSSAITYTMGSVAGKKLKVDIAAAIITKTTPAERDGINIYQIDWSSAVSLTAGNNEVTFTWL